MTSPPTHPTLDNTPGDDSLLIEDQRFSIIPEWVIDADIPDSCFRLYSLLLRYGNGTGNRMPSRATLARRLRRSVDAIDRALRVLSEAGIVRVEHRRAGAQHLPNRYHVRTSDPAGKPTNRGSRVSAATPEPVRSAGRTSAATPSRISAAGVAAEVRHDQEVLTERRTPPPLSPTLTTRDDQSSAKAHVELLSACGIDDLPVLSARLTAIRRSLGRPTTRWSGPCLLVAIQLAVTLRGWPASRVVEALTGLAADPESRSPARLAEAGPWWDEAAAPEVDTGTLAALEWRLAETGGVRPLVQKLARQELDAQGLPRTRAAVAQRACQILDRRAAEGAAAPDSAASSPGAGYDVVSDSTQSARTQSVQIEGARS